MAGPSATSRTKQGSAGSGSPSGSTASRCSARPASRTGRAARHAAPTRSARTSETRSSACDALTSGAPLGSPANWPSSASRCRPRPSTGSSSGEGSTSCGRSTRPPERTPDVKKVGKIPDGGGWRVHGRDSQQALESRRKKNKRPGYTYIHAAVDDHSRLAYAECLNDERAVTAVEFLERALIFFASHGITDITSVLTDNGSCYISGLWKATMKANGIKHRRTRRQTPRTNGKVERFNSTMKDEWLYVRAYTSEEDRRNHLVPFLNAYNHDRSHSAIGNRPPISRAPAPGPRLTAEPIVAPLEDRPGQMSLDLTQNPDE